MQASKKQFSGYFETYYRQLCLHALHFMGNSEDAEDVVQEIFVHLWDKRERLDTVSSVKSYLYKAVRNNCLTRIRCKTYHLHRQDPTRPTTFGRGTGRARRNGGPHLEND